MDFSKEITSFYNITNKSKIPFIKFTTNYNNSIEFYDYFGKINPNSIETFLKAQESIVKEVN